VQIPAFKAEYGKLYPEAVRSLAEEVEKPLTFDEFPQTMRRYIQITNTIESLFSNVCQGIDQIDLFTTEMSCLMIVWATIEWRDSRFSLVVLYAKSPHGKSPGGASIH